MNLTRTLSSLIVLLIIAPLAVEAASFDCAKAKTPIENTICADQELSRLDEELARRYATSLNAALGDEDRVRLRQEQRAWLKSRDACESARCFAESYRGRIAALQGKPQPPQSKRYPPYPEVWGRELPFPSSEYRHVISRYWKTANGDIKILYSLAGTHSLDSSKSAQGQAKKILGLLFFFSGERQLLSGPEADEERKRPSTDRDLTSTIIEKITFRDGSAVRVKVVFDQAFDRKCFISHPYSLQRIDGNGKVLAERSIVYLNDRPVKFVSQEICNGGEANVALVRSVTDGPVLIPLEDETFLVRFRLGHYVLRLDKELLTKYSPSTRLSIVDTGVINGIRAKYEALRWPLNEQMINDEVTNYLLQLPRGRKK